MASEMNFAIRYLTEYSYDSEVVDNLNALRVRPRDNSRQRCDEFSVRLTPEVRLHRHTDYFGTEVVEFEVSRPHRAALRRCAGAGLDAPPPKSRPRTTWEALGDPVVSRGRAVEFLLQTDDAPGHPVLEQLLAAGAEAASPCDLVMQVATLIPDRFEYRKGATFVDSKILDLLEAGAGVCQDFVHLGLCLLRHLGHRRALRVGGTCTRRATTTAASRSRSTPTPGSRRCCPSPTPDPALPSPVGEPVWIGADPTNRGLSRTRATSRSATAATTPTYRRSRACIAVPRAPSCRRASR